MADLITELCLSLDKARRFISLVEMDAPDGTKQAAQAQLAQIAAVSRQGRTREGWVGC
jgi:hypothetical protein